MDNPEKLATLGTQHTRRIQKKTKKTPQKIKNKNKQTKKPRTPPQHFMCWALYASKHI
jgi:hypothetical protein